MFCINSERQLITSFTYVFICTELAASFCPFGSSSDKPEEDLIVIVCSLPVLMFARTFVPFYRYRMLLRLWLFPRGRLEHLLIKFVVIAVQLDGHVYLLIRIAATRVACWDCSVRSINLGEHHHCFNTTK